MVSTEGFLNSATIYLSCSAIDILLATASMGMSCTPKQDSPTTQNTETYIS